MCISSFFVYNWSTGCTDVLINEIEIQNEMLTENVIKIPGEELLVRRGGIGI